MTAPPVILPNTQTPDQPSYRDTDYLDQQPFWILCQDIKASTPKIRERKEVYLPRFMAESVQDWQARVQLTFADNHYDQTLADHVGLVFSEDPLLDKDAPDELDEFAENVDGEGSHFAVFAKNFFETALDYGHAAILTDFPPVPSGQRVDKRMAKSASLRPFWSIIRADQIVNKRWTVVGGRLALTQVTIAENVAVADGDFGTKFITQYRVFSQDVHFAMMTPGDTTPTAIGLGAIHWQIWQPMKQDTRVGQTETYTLTTSGDVTGPTRIPLAICYGGSKLGPMRSRPHLIGMAYTNLEETQVKSDYARVMHVCNVPTPVFIGRPVAPTGQKGSDTVQMGQGIDIPIGGDAKFMEPSGVALRETRERMDDIREQLRRQGAWIRDGGGAPAMTATEAVQIARRTNARLVTAARSLQDALEHALADAAAFMGLDLDADGDGDTDEGSGGSVIVNKDFGLPTVNPVYLQALTAIYTAGGLPLDALLYAAKFGELPEEFEPEEAALNALNAETQKMKAHAMIAADNKAAALANAQGDNGKNGTADAPPSAPTPPNITQPATPV